MTVHADAQVDIPDTSQLSIFRVQQMQFDQAFLDQVRTTLFGEQTLYDGTCLSQLTKADYESEIQAGKDDIAEIQNNNLYSDDDKEVMIQERQSNIDECQAKYETAPEAINYTGSPSDNQTIHPMNIIHGRVNLMVQMPVSFTESTMRPMVHISHCICRTMRTMEI